jgi:hypothetical protein
LPESLLAFLVVPVDAVDHAVSDVPAVVGPESSVTGVIAVKSHIAGFPEVACLVVVSKVFR